jgi:hypothetical protein
MTSSCRSEFDENKKALCSDAQGLLFSELESARELHWVASAQYRYNAFGLLWTGHRLLYGNRHFC